MGRTRTAARAARFTRVADRRPIVVLNGRIRDDINEPFTRDPDIDPSEIEVDVDRGIVTLRGIVEDRSEKRLVEDVIDGVFAVVDIDNELEVRHGIIAALTGEKASHSEIASDTTNRDRSDEEPSPVRRTAVKATVR